MPLRAAAFALCLLSPCALAAGLSLPEDQLTCIAQAVYHEARSEPQRAQRAVAAVVLNRVRSPDFPDTACAVVRQGGERPPCQFSWWCDGRSDRPREAEAWDLALRIAAEVAADPARDPTGGALYFHRDDVDPHWRGAFTPAAEIGRHIYYRVE